MVYPAVLLPIAVLTTVYLPDGTHNAVVCFVLVAPLLVVVTVAIPMITA